jgi:hypothetical protein
MIVLHVDPVRITVFELEGDADRPVHVNRVALRPEPSEGVKVVARDIHVFWALRDIEGIEPL